MALQSLLCAEVFDINLCENEIENHESASTVMNNNTPVQGNDNFNPEGSDSEQQASKGSPCVPVDKTGHDGDGRKPLCRQIHSYQSRGDRCRNSVGITNFQKTFLTGELDVDTACSAPAVSRIKE